MKSIHCFARVGNSSLSQDKKNTKNKSECETYICIESIQYTSIPYTLVVITNQTQHLCHKYCYLFTVSQRQTSSKIRRIIPLKSHQPIITTSKPGKSCINKLGAKRIKATIAMSTVVSGVGVAGSGGVLVTATPKILKNWTLRSTKYSNWNIDG